MKKLPCWLYLIISVCIFLPAEAEAVLSSAENRIAITALEKSKSYERKHIVLIWPEKLKVNWYPESGVKGPEQLADWLERCYVLCTGWLKINPNRQLNANKNPAEQARLIFVHNGMRDYNYGGKLPRPVIGLRNLSGVGSEDWFGWLTHELSHEFILRFPEIAADPENNTWHEALCDYLRYWLLKESGMPEAAKNWMEVLRRAPNHDRYKGGAFTIMNYHNRQGCKSPADLWLLIKGKNLTSCFGNAPWHQKKAVAVPRGYTRIEFEGIIDGAGSFTFRKGKIYYKHFTWQYPRQVKINGKKWQNIKDPFELGFDFDPATARAVETHGRDTMGLIPHKDRLVIFIDDFENSSSLYRITFLVKKWK